MLANRNIKLNSGYECPMLGYGTWQSTDKAQLKLALKAAIEAGYRHIDTAFVYHNEGMLGEILEEFYKSNLIKREDLFLTTKIMAQPEVLSSLKGQLEQLKTSYVDLYLIHFPVPIGSGGYDYATTLEQTWAAMEKCVDAGLARSIGVSNFNIKQVERILRSARIKPVMLQAESHPGFQNTKLIEFCQRNGVVFTAYSCFGSPGTFSSSTGKPSCDLDLLHDDRIINIGKKYGKNAAQVILRWQLQRNVVVIPKSLTPSRVVDNFNVWDFKLNGEDMMAMAAIDLNKRWSWIKFPGIEHHPEYPFQADGGSC